MPDLRQALKDFVATSNSGKYATEEELLSKFPELKGYDVQVLRDFVATNNSGKYKTEDELFAKFPEFKLGGEVKKKFSSDSEPSQQPQPKAMVSSLEDGSLDTPPPIKIGKKFSKSELREQPVEVSRDATFVKIPQIKTTKKEFIEQEKKAVEERKYEDAFRYFSVKPKPSESSYLKERLQSVNTELMNFEQDYVANELDYQFGDLGFKFEPSGVIGDYVKVTAPNNKTIEISVDNLFDKKSKQQSETLKKFITENTPAKGLFVLEKTMREQDKKFNSQKQVDDSIKAITNEVNLLNQKQKEILLRKSSLDKEIEEYRLNPTQEKLIILQQKKAQFDADVKKVLEEESTIKSKGLRLNQAVAKYGMSKAREGSWIGGIWDSFNRGIGRMSSGVSSLLLDAMVEATPTHILMSEKDLKTATIDIVKEMGIKGPSENQTIDQWKSTLTEDQLDDWEDRIDDYAKKDVKGKILPYIRIGAEEVFGDPATTTQWADLKKKDFWGGAILGVAESLPAMIGGAGPAGWAQRTAQMYAQISDSVNEEMENDPDFKNITENEKLALTLPIGITSAVLEAYGLRNVLASKGVINSIALRALGRAGVGASAKTFRELVENEVNSMLAKGLLTITAAGAAEFETGALQELSETGYKVLYDRLKEKDMFNTPDSITDLIENVAVAGAQEAVGGFLLGIPSGVSAAYSKKGFLAMDDNTFETFASMANDSNMQSAYIASLKQQITQGIITEREAKEQLNDYRNSVGLYRQLPDGLTTQQKKEAMNLLKERKDLENYIQNKDAALVTKQKSRIDEINNLLTNLSETNAIQEQSPAAVPVQPETRDSQTMEEGVSQPKPEVVTEQITQEEVKDFDLTLPDNKDNIIIADSSNGFILVDSETKQPIEVFNDNAGENSGISKPYATQEEAQARIEELKQPVQEIDLGIDIPENPLMDIPSTSTALGNAYYEERKYDEYKEIKKIAGLEDAGTFTEISKAYHKAKIDGTNPELVKAVEELLAPKTQEEVVGVQDEISQPIELSVPKVEEAKAEEATVEEKFIIDGKEYTKEEAIEKYQSQWRYPFFESKMEYIGNNPQSKEFADDYNRQSNPYNSKGSLRENYMKQKIYESMSKLGFRRFGNLFRKHIDPYFTRESRESEKRFSKGTTWEEIAGYIIGDGSYYIDDKMFRAFAKEAGIDIPEFKAETAPTTEPQAVSEQDIASLETEANRPVEKIGSETKTEVATKAKAEDTTSKFTPIQIQEFRVESAKSLLDEAKTKAAKKKAMTDLIREENRLAEMKELEKVKAEATATTTETDKIKSDVEASKERLKKAWDKYKTVGIAFDPKNNLARDKELVSALVEYAYQKTKLGAYTASKLIEDLANEGFKITRNGAKFIMDKVASEALKEEVRDLKGQVVDVFRAGIDSMKVTGRTAKEKAKAIKEKTQEIAKYLGDLEKSGKITSKQASALIRRFSKVNALSEKSVNRFIDYATKIINDATYNSKILAANKVRKEIKKLSRNKDKNADLRNIASKFAEIDPSMVDDIDQYNEIASRVKEAVKGSKKRLDKITIARTVNIDEVSNYVSETIKSQDEKIRQEMIAEIQSLMDIDASDLSAEEMISLLDSEEKINKENESVVRKTLKKAFDVYSTMINESIRTGKNLFTDEDIKYTQKQKDIISKFMKMDTDKMTVKEALGAIDSLINFLGNGSTAKMATTIAEYTGEQNSQEVVDNKKLVRTSLKKLWSKAFAKFLGEQITSLPILFEKKFKGFNAGGYVMDKMGLNDLINKKSLAQRMANTIVDNYVKEFYKKTANGQAFNTLFNSIERGMASFVMRNIVGTEAEMQEEFNRRKGLIEQSIDALQNGNKDEKSMAKVYKEVYDKILKDSSNSDQVKSKANSTNIDAVNWWVNEWDNKFEELSDVAKNIYNKTLDRDLDYTPDKFTKFKYDRGDSDLANSDSAFINNTDGILYKKETGVLMSKKPSSMLPENKKGNPTAYVDLSFDKNNSNSMYDALVDMQTAESVRQIQSFMDSKNFEKIFGEDSQIFKNRIKLYIQNSRKKNPFSQDELSKALKSLNRIASIGASVSLAGPTQPIKQVFPVVVNTLINTGGKIDLTNDKNFNEWLNKAGYAISNRGIESQAQIDSINKLIEQAANSKGEALIKKLEELNKFYLKIYLANPDVYIARASWKSYYEKSLENQGVKTKDLDYSNHEVNKEAADYAQKMVDRQQNISDTDLSGKLFSAKDTSTQVLTKIFMPFASFRMNQSSRLAADLTTLGYWNSATKEDRQIAIKSLSGFVLEQTVFKTLSALISIGMASLASSYMGDDDDDEKKRKNQLIKGAATGTVSDIFSPLPVADRFVQWTAAKGLDFSQDMMGLSDEQKISLYEPKTQDFFQQLGMFGIVGTKASDVASLVDIYATGTYEDKYGNIRDVSNENREKLGALIGPAILAGMGILPPETSSFIRNSEKIAKKKAPTLEEKIEKDNKIEELKKIIDESSSQDEIDAAEKMINKLESPEIYEEENQYLKELKQSLLVDEENGVTYDNVTDLKNFNPDLWEKNFGPGSEWDDLTKGEKELKRTLKKKEESEKEEKYGIPSQKKERNSDGTRKRKYKTYRKFRKTKD